MATLYSKIEQYIREGINNGRWRAGDVLPKEIELCEMFSVSRPTVRTALSNLVQEGLITRTKRKGTVVKEWRTLESSTVFIESFQQEMASKGINVATEVLEFRLIDAPDVVCEKLDLPVNTMVVKLTRLRYAKDSFESGPIVLTNSYLRGDLWAKIQSCDMERIALRETLRNHGWVRTVMEKEITIHNLNEREARLLGEQPETAVIKINTISWDQNGKKIEFCESIYPASRNRFLLRIRK